MRELISIVFSFFWREAQAGTQADELDIKNQISVRGYNVSRTGAPVCQPGRDA
jgi:hypothetical protein